MSGSDSGSGSGSVGPPPEWAELVENAPPAFRIGQALDDAVRCVPQEVKTFLEERGSGIGRCKRLKISFHATFVLELAPPLVDPESGDSHEKAILQVLGAQMVDKAVYGPQVSAAMLSRAMELASAAGVRTAQVFGTGTCQFPLGELDWILQEMIETKTVEDKVKAPAVDWRRIAGAAAGALRNMSVEDTPTDPIPRYDTLEDFLRFCAGLVPPADAELAATLDMYIASVAEALPEPQPPVLMHQDINDGNLLCSPPSSGQGSWQLDALIDWESAAVGDPRLLSDEEPWQTARALGLVAKGSHMAGHLARANASGSADRDLPRCELAELIEHYEKAARKLDRTGLLQYQSFVDKVAAMTSLVST